MTAFAAAVVAILSAIGTLYAAVAGGRATFRNARSTEQKSAVEMMQAVVTQLRQDVDAARSDITKLQGELKEERVHSQRQDHEISNLRGMVTAWVQWYSFLVTGWDHLRQKDTPPDAPTETTTELPKGSNS